MIHRARVLRQEVVQMLLVITNGDTVQVVVVSPSDETTDRSAAAL